MIGDSELETEKLGAGKFGQRHLLDSITKIEDVLSALRLLKKGEFSCPGVVSTNEAWLLKSGLQFQLRATHPFGFGNYELADKDVGKLQIIWNQLTSEKFYNRTFLNAALRRFNMAFDRRRGDDRLVDLMIASESLFLNDVGNAAGRGELRFRLAVRVAKFIDSPRYKPRQVFHLMRDAYDLRSKVVHGDTIKTAKLPDNSAATLNEFISELEEVMRLGIQKALINPEAGRPEFWEELLFSS